MKRKQQGATLVEFALILIIFLAFFLGIVDFARLMWTWNAATEATRWGARTAVVCAQNSNAAVLEKMQAYLPEISAATVTWDPAGCDRSNCSGVTVEIPANALQFNWISPLGSVFSLSSITAPKFSTYLPRESMGFVGNDPTTNPDCN